MAGKKTRTRILVASLLLFNEHGEPNTTTNEIADEVDISPGNLHYHFRKKSELVEALLAEFQVDARRVLQPPDDDTVIDDFWVFVHLLLETLAAYRFLVRDLETLVATYPKVGRTFTHFAKGLLAVMQLYVNALNRNGLLHIDPDEREREVARFALPRQNRENGLSIADFVRDRADGTRDVIGLQVVTVGQRASEVARAWFAEDRYRDYLYLHGFGVEMAEALAEYVHKRVRAELGFAGEDARDRDRLLQQGYRGSRYSFGYPACPNLEDQEQILDLLGAGRIGLSLSEGYQLHPEQSTSAIVLHHPQAKYFSV